MENNDTRPIYVIKAELPGMKEDEVTVTLNNNIVAIAGEKRPMRRSRTRST